MDLQKEAVYGLTELSREAVKGARLLANPGCYPTCSQLPLYPLVKVWYGGALCGYVAAILTLSYLLLYAPASQGVVWGHVVWITS